MSIFTKLANVWASPTNSDGTPRKIAPQDMQVWGTEIERIVDAFVTGGGLIFNTKAQIDSSLDYPVFTMAWVIQDPVVANNGIYQKSGASGTGSWSRRGDLPYSFIRLIDAGDGTANAIQLTSSLPTSLSVMRAANVFEANTGNVTVSENGATAKPLLTNSGNQIAVGGLVAGSVIVYADDGANFRLLSDQASAAIQAAAEAAQVAAEAAAAAAESAYTALATGVVPFGSFSGDGVETEFTLPIAPIVSGNCAVFIDGVFQDYQARSIAGTTLTFTDPPPNGTTISGVIFAPVDDLATPPAASVSAAAIDTGDAANIRTALSVYSKAETDTLIKGVKGSNIASAATIDLGAATGDFVDITGTATISSFGTAAAGVERTVRFTSGATLTHSSSLLLFSGFTGLNWVVPSNTVMRFRSLGSGTWVETSQTPTQGSGAPTIEFGGASTGVTYAGGNTGRWVRRGKMMTWRGRLFLLTKGSSTGNAVIRSFPAPVANLVSDSALISNFSALAGLTGAPSGVRAAVTDGISLQQSGAAATANLTDANFTDSSSIFFILIYEGA